MPCFGTTLPRLPGPALPLGWEAQAQVPGLGTQILGMKEVWEQRPSGLTSKGRLAVLLVGEEAGMDLWGNGLVGWLLLRRVAGREDGD